MDDSVPQDGLTLLPPKPMPGYAKQLVYLRQQTYVDAVEIEPEETDDDGGDHKGRTEEQ